VSLAPGPVLDVLDWITQTDAAIGQAQRHLAAAVIRARQNGRP